MYAVEYDAVPSLCFAEIFFYYDKFVSQVPKNVTTVVYNCLPGQLSVVPWAHTNYKMFPWTRSNWVRQDRERRPFNIFSVTFLWAVSFQFSLVAVCGFLQLCLVEYVGCIAMRSTGHRPHLSAGWSVQRCVQPYTDVRKPSWEGFIWVLCLICAQPRGN